MPDGSSHIVTDCTGSYVLIRRSRLSSGPTGAQTSGSNALQIAVISGRLHLLRCLLSLGANAPDCDHRPKLFNNIETPLHSAVGVGSVDDYGADTALHDSKGKSVTEKTQQEGREDIIERTTFLDLGKSRSDKKNEMPGFNLWVSLPRSPLSD